MLAINYCEGISDYFLEPLPLSINNFVCISVYINVVYRLVLPRHCYLYILHKYYVVTVIRLYLLLIDSSKANKY